MEEEAKKGPPGIDVEAGRIRFDFIKSNYFRVIHVEGVFGGNSPRGLINMAVFNERWPIPKQITHEFTDGQSGEEIERTSRDAVVREVEAQLVMNIETAKIICKWLESKIKNAEKQTKAEEE
jgi:hypothetical protein